MDSRFHHDFSHVRVHADDRAARSATALGAAAYTVGSDIVFGANRYAPATIAGRHLIAHELAHVVQQGTRASRSSAAAVNQTAPAALERNAATAAGAALTGHPVHVDRAASTPAIQCQPASEAGAPPAADARAEIVRLAGSEDAADRQRALDLIISTYYQAAPGNFERIVYDPDYVAHYNAAHPGDPGGISPQHADTGPAPREQPFGGRQRITIGPAFFRHFAERYAQRIRTVGHELQHVEQRSPAAQAGKRTLGSTLLGGLAFAAGGALLGAGALGIASLAGATISGGLAAGVIGGAAALGLGIGALVDPFTSGAGRKEPLRNVNTREFLAIYWTVTAEVRGLEQMEIGQRIQAIEQRPGGALDRYSRMPADDQRRYERQYLELQQLLERLRRERVRGDFPVPEQPRSPETETAVA